MGKSNQPTAPLFTPGGNREAAGVIVGKNLAVRTATAHDGTEKVWDEIVFETGETFEIAANWHPNFVVNPGDSISVKCEYGPRPDGSKGMNYSMAQGIDGFLVNEDDEAPEF